MPCIVRAMLVLQNHMLQWWGKATLRRRVLRPDIGGGHPSVDRGLVGQKVAAGLRAAARAKAVAGAVIPPEVGDRVVLKVRQGSLAAPELDVAPA